MFNLYPEIEYDNYYIKQRAGNLPRLDPIEPHHGREINLMKAGFKLCAVIHKINWCSEWSDACKENNWRYLLSTVNEDIYVAVSGEFWRVDALDFIYKHALSIGSLTTEHSVVIGRLLGYDQESVDKYLEFFDLPKKEAYKIIKERWK